MIGVDELSIEALGHLINDVFLPIVNIAAELKRDRELAIATLQSLNAGILTKVQHERVLSSQIRRTVVPHYIRLRDHYLQYQSDIGSWISVRSGELQDSLNGRPAGYSADLLYEDHEMVLQFVLGSQCQLTRMSARLRELTF
jgi:hypothetical protein